MEEKIHSNIYLAALNMMLTILVYFFVAAFAHYYLKHFHHIDMLRIFSSSFKLASFPLLGEMFGFMSTLVEHVVVDALIVGMLYAAYIANYKITIKDGKLSVEKGFLVVNKEEFPLQDVEHVFTKDYPFFKDTKILCIKSLDEDVIKVPYVTNAAEVKNRILEQVRESHHQLEIERELGAPVNVPSSSPQ